MENQHHVSTLLNICTFQRNLMHHKMSWDQIATALNSQCMAEYSSHVLQSACYYQYKLSKEYTYLKQQLNFNVDDVDDPLWPTYCVTREENAKYVLEAVRNGVFHLDKCIDLFGSNPLPQIQGCVQENVCDTVLIRWMPSEGDRFNFRATGSSSHNSQTMNFYSDGGESSASTSSLFASVTNRVRHILASLPRNQSAVIFGSVYDSLSKGLHASRPCLSGLMQMSDAEFASWLKARVHEFKQGGLLSSDDAAEFDEWFNNS